MTDTKQKPKKIIPITAEDSQEQMVFLYEKQKKIYPRLTSGFFTNTRWLMVWITQIVFYGMPWLMWGDRQAFLLDISTHRFYIFGLVLYPQDLIYLAIILIVSALALFLFTAVAGRLWCGFSCPQSVYTKIFLWIESKVEGDRAARIKLDSSPYDTKKLYKKSLKHAIWILFSMWTGFTFLGYFSPIRGLFENIALFNLSPWETFWIIFYGFATYGNAGFLREQVCKYMCPYARFQSAMFDKDTLIVSYDVERGEPRGSRARNVDAKEKGLGDCVDCSFCVQVCPTGIDIRDGLQYECISCGLCVDACNGVMDKLGYARGLIKFSTQNGVSNHWNTSQLLQQVLRPRVLIYSAVLLGICVAFVISLTLRASFNVDVIRDRGVMSRMAPGGYIENVYRLNITNSTEKQQMYQITVIGLDGLKVATNPHVMVAPASTRMLPVSLQILDGKAQAGTHKIMFNIEAQETKEKIEEKSIFFIGN